MCCLQHFSFSFFVYSLHNAGNARENAGNPDGKLASASNCSAFSAFRTALNIIRNAPHQDRPVSCARLRRSPPAPSPPPPPAARSDDRPDDY